MSAKLCDRLALECDLWRTGVAPVAGADEAGCGPLAGPVVAAAVVLPAAWLDGGIVPELKGLNDSKQLTERQRESYFEILQAHPEIRSAIAHGEIELIDRVNIRQAAWQTMNKALDQLNPRPRHVLIDGLRIKWLRYPQTALAKGDSKSYSIAAASILAKVTRDRLMLEFDKQYPGYGFARHKGYATPQHLVAIRALGPCPIHRRSFWPFKPEPEANQRELIGVD
jgi:ribonuclease HII